MKSTETRIQCAHSTGLKWKRQEQTHYFHQCLSPNTFLPPSLGFVSFQLDCYGSGVFLTADWGHECDATLQSFPPEWYTINKKKMNMEKPSKIVKSFCAQTSRCFFFFFLRNVGGHFTRRCVTYRLDQFFLLRHIITKKMLIAQCNSDTVMTPLQLD